jgi:hypothetical protein
VIEELELSASSDRLKRAFNFVSMLPHKKMEIVTFCKYLLKNNICEEALILNEINQFKLTYGDQLMIKKLLTPSIFH